MKIKLSKTQQAVLRACYEHQGDLRRCPGGFWTYPGSVDEKADRKGERGHYAVPAWWVGVATATVRSMERLGLLIRSHVHDEEWRDERTITALGRAIAKTMTRRYHISRRELFQLAGSAVQSLSKSVQGDHHHG